MTDGDGDVDHDDGDDDANMSDSSLDEEDRIHKLPQSLEARH